ncbi:hypothetical protein ACRE_089270 [Hapsidospora chrysogenum ATCC 11550]|uniref:Uncharacterized protein n=1 Tax=Hapsidospora chrysogenum (strain ATCC 11550 / CBS 779.69 / DSM 880 / IAM 14645 / JCM 23072 / IMI 49137) TaxID=857340 RepID=A0A086STH4_HAPC1|nr:hypothetical protein ACRE_089270 [Hapsidospora chrysogenum ATCC 11550]
MAAPTTCRRAGQRQAPIASQATVWITDMMLRQAIDQYQRRFLVTNRALSSNRVLFECRRRPLGKRHMADMMASPTPYRPTWWFELMGSKTAWKWQSPTTTQYRREKEKSMTFSDLVDRFITWLEASDLDKPFLQTPDALGESVPVTSRVQEPTLMAEVDGLREGIRAMDTINTDELRELTRTCSRALEARLNQGEFTSEQIYQILEPLDAAAIDSRLSDAQLQSLGRSIAGTVISTVASLRRLGDTKLYNDAWAAVVKKTFDMEPCAAKFRLFRYMMHEASTADMDSIEDSQFKKTIEEFICTTADSFQDTLFIVWMARTSRFSLAVDRLSGARFGSILENANFEVWDKEGTRRRWLTWLLIRAYLTRSTTHDVADLARQFRLRHGTMRNPEVRVVSIARLVSQGFLDYELVARMSKSRFKNPASWWTDLADIALKKGGTDSLKSLMVWLHHSGHPTLFLRSLISTLLHPETESLGVRAQRVVEKVISDPELNHDRGPLSQAVHIVKNRIGNPRTRITGPQDTPGKQTHELRATLEFIEWLAYRYMVSEHLRDRQALRGVEWCLRSYERLSPGHRGSPKILVILSRILIRDLEAGRWGRTQRLKWLISKIEQYQGTAQARKTVRAVEGWRSMIDEQMQGRRKVT